MLDPALGDKDGVLESDAADPLEIQTGLDRDHIPDHQVVGAAPHPRSLVYIETNTVTKGVHEALHQQILAFVMELGRETFRVEVIRNSTERIPCARLERVEGNIECFAHMTVQVA